MYTKTLTKLSKIILSEVYNNDFERRVGFIKTEINKQPFEYMCFKQLTVGNYFMPNGQIV